MHVEFVSAAGGAGQGAFCQVKDQGGSQDSPTTEAERGEMSNILHEYFTHR